LATPALLLVPAPMVVPLPAVPLASGSTVAQPTLMLATDTTTDALTTRCAIFIF
jgi:hypothetical protein